MILLSHNPFYQALVGGLAAVLTFVLFYGIFFLLSLFKKKKCSRDIEDTQVIDSADNIVKEKSVSTNKTKWKKRIVKTIGWLILIAACIVAAAIAITEYNRHQEYVDAQPIDSPEYIADSTIKTVTLESNGKEYVIYKDYYWKHTICLENNFISIRPYYGCGGGWELQYGEGPDITGETNVGIRNCGKVSSIEDIASHSIIYGYSGLPSYGHSDKEVYSFYDEEDDNKNYHSCSIVFEPNHGYEAAFRAGSDKDVKYMRIYPTKYKLDDEDKLSSVTLQYQLF